MGALGPSGAPACTERVASFMRRGLSPATVRFKRHARGKKKAPGRNVRGLRNIEANRCRGGGGIDHSPGGERFTRKWSSIRATGHRVEITREPHARTHAPDCRFASRHCEDER